MKYFSWSKKTSLLIAKQTKILIEEVTKRPDIVWLSEETVQYGIGLFESVSDALNNCEFGVFFPFKDSLFQQWLDFEAEALISKDKRIWCLLINTNGNRSLSNTPFGHIQTLQIKKHDFERLFKELCSIYGDNYDDYKIRFDECWPRFEEETKKIILANHIDEGTDIKDIVSHYTQIYNDAVSTDSITTIPCGFETHELYDYVLKQCTKRLWVFGRKNKKLFDIQHNKELIELGLKISDGCDFRCLFFSPKTTGYEESFLQNKRHFHRALETSIDDALDRCCDANISSQKCFRYYSGLRNTAMIIIDNTVMFAHVSYNLDGTPMHLTNVPFHIVDVDSMIGKQLINEFATAWNGGVLVE
ncbi:hypothetical protein [Butyrivibrio sp. AE2032]|uniref:hypothetical protein n=1 Tax=Butyrivibrio sp. AE2032 TaxID=1458463 RepID=UPI00054F3CE9|nr:hypothetical protein [Butyrivibrio sp. AE2032]